MQSAPSVDKNVKFHSNLILADLYTAENVTLNEDPREEIGIKLTSWNLFTIFNLSFLHPFFVVKSNYKRRLQEVSRVEVSS